MTNKNEQLFQERIDELLLMEQRIERQAEQLTKYNEDFQMKINKSLAGLDGVIRKVSNDIYKLGEVNIKVNEHMQTLARYSKKTIITFGATIILVGLIVGWGSVHLKCINQEIESAEIKLAALDVKLSYTPVIEQYQEGDYVRIVPNSDIRFKHNDKAVGTYAKVWHAER